MKCISDHQLELSVSVGCLHCARDRRAKLSSTPTLGTTVFVLFFANERKITLLEWKTEKKSVGEKQVQQGREGNEKKKERNRERQRESKQGKAIKKNERKKERKKVRKKERQRESGQAREREKEIERERVWPCNVCLFAKKAKPFLCPNHLRVKKQLSSSRNFVEN